MFEKIISLFVFLFWYIYFTVAKYVRCGNVKKSIIFPLNTLCEKGKIIKLKDDKYIVTFGDISKHDINILCEYSITNFDELPSYITSDMLEKFVPFWIDKDDKLINGFDFSWLWNLHNKKFTATICTMNDEMKVYTQIITPLTSYIKF